MRKIALALVLGLCSAALTGCVHHQYARPAPHRHPAPSHARAHKPGPPPHAPAHGYRHKHRGGVELAFDSGIGVYVVVGHPNHYFHDRHYLRLADGAWYISASFDGRWTTVSAGKVPKGLLNKHAKPKKHAKSKKKHHPRHVPAKHGY